MASIQRLLVRNKKSDYTASAELKISLAFKDKLSVVRSKDSSLLVPGSKQAGRAVRVVELVKNRHTHEWSLAAGEAYPKS